MDQITLQNEIKRKIFHLLILIYPALYYYFGKWQALTILAPITLIIFLADYYRHRNFRIKLFVDKFFSSILRAHETADQKLCGATWAALAACLTFLFCKEQVIITAFIILAISDTIAALVGRSFGVKPFFEKTLAGSIAFYVSGLIILFACGAFYNVNLWFYFFGFFALFCATILEARPSFFNIDDNFVVPVSFAFVMTIFDLIWNYIY